MSHAQNAKRPRSLVVHCGGFFGVGRDNSCECERAGVQFDYQIFEVLRVGRRVGILRNFCLDCISIGLRDFLIVFFEQLVGRGALHECRENAANRFAVYFAINNRGLACVSQFGDGLFKFGARNFATVDFGCCV